MTYLIHMTGNVTRALVAIRTDAEIVSDSDNKCNLFVTIEIIKIILNDEYHGGRETEV